MKRLFLLLGFSSLIACTNELEESAPSDEVNQITMTVKDFELDNKDSRMSVDVSPSGAVFKWSANDTVGIFPNEGAQAYFPMTNGAGTNQASFTGGGWALKTSSKYAAYYPYNFYNRDLKKIAVNYEGQTQKGNGSTAHLGAYDYMAAVATTPSSGKVNFDFQHLGCLVELNVTLPKASTYNSITLSCDEAVFTKRGTIDLSQSTPKIISKVPKSSDFTVKFKSLVTTQENDVVTVYFITAPVNLKGKILNISVDNNGFSEQLGTVVISKDWIAGRYYQIRAMSNSDNLLWVDLGLPSGLLWASHNVGAEKPEDYGDYFAWGEITPKESYDKFTSLTYGKTMKDFSGNPQYDAATANWGAPARMPKKTELDELQSKCTWTWVESKEGYSVLGPNGNSIFLPAASFKYGTSFQYAGEMAFYWSSTPNEDDDIEAYRLDFCSEIVTPPFRDPRFFGFSVRPVRD